MTEMALEVAASGVESVEEIYRSHYDLLHGIAVGRFRLPADAAENLIHEVFVSLIGQIEEIRNVRSWLVGAIYNSCRHYHRVSERTEDLPDDYATKPDPRAGRLADHVALELTVRQTLDSLPPKSRETLRMHYFEGCSAVEIAERLDTTPRYAEKLIHTSLRQAHAVYSTLMRSPQ